MLNQDICVSVRGVSKKFSRSLKRSFIYGAHEVGRATLGLGERDELRPSEFWAVRDVSLELRRGQSIGIVGLNGSGKTTLLRMISGILRPTLGEINVRGRIAPMLALGAGFKPVLSGRENIFLNLSLLGVVERDIRARLNSVIDFSELEDSIDAPLGTYSSGMLARLGFSCAIHTDPSILVVDEVLSVGDARFRVKCRNRINDMRRSGTSMLLVSHSAILVETLCDECIFLQQGKVASRGAPREVLAAYEAEGLQQAFKRNDVQALELAEREVIDSQVLGVRSVTLDLPGNGENGFWSCGRPGELRVLLQCAIPVGDVSINVMIFDLTHQPGETVQFLMSSRDIGWLRFEPGTPEIRLKMPEVGLRPGTYRLKLSVSRGAMYDILDVVDNIRLIVKDAGKASNCLYFQQRDWQVSGGESTGAPVVQEDVDMAVSDDL